MNKRLLIVGAGHEQIYAYELARRNGIKTVGTDANPRAPAFNFSDDRIIASTYDVEETVKEVAKYNSKKPIDGVMTLASDSPLTVAAVANELGLPGISIESAKIASNKLLMKKRFEKDGVAIPWFKKVESTEQLKSIVKDRGYPLVIKPVDSRGARGVIRLTEDVDVEWAFDNAVKNSPTATCMVEEWVNGPQVSTESMIWDDEFITPGLSDRNYEYLERFAPSIIENGGTLPSESVKDKSGLDKLLKRAAESIGIRRGVIKGDIVITENGPKIIEIAARLSGGYFCTHEIPISTGVNIVQAAINVSLGIKPDFEKLKPKYNKPIVQRYLFPTPGVVKKIDGIEKLSAIEGIVLHRIYINRGDKIERVTNHTQRAGMIMATGKTKEIALERVKRAIKSIAITYEKNK